MQITVSFGSGLHIEGVVLSSAGTRLRVALQNWDDAAEFQCRHGQWFLENRDPVLIAWPDLPWSFVTRASPAWVN